MKARENMCFSIIVIEIFRRKFIFAKNKKFLKYNIFMKGDKIDGKH